MTPRTLVCLGTVDEAATWLTDHPNRTGPTVVIQRVQSVITLSARHTHLVVFPSYWHLPHHFLLRTAITFLRRRGATIEWA